MDGMGRERNIVDGIKIASPCHMSWDRMMGDDQVRFCESCKLHVFNISEMDVEEAANLISKMDGRLCVRLHRRRDGKVMTRDCPVGARMALRKAFAAMAGAVVLLLTGLCWAAGSLLGGSRSREEVMGSVQPMSAIPDQMTHTMGAIAPLNYRPNHEPSPVEQGEVTLEVVAKRTVNSDLKTPRM
jgi:hypothetical protein